MVSALYQIWPVRGVGRIPPRCGLVLVRAQAQRMRRRVRTEKHVERSWSRPTRHQIGKRNLLRTVLCVLQWDSGVFIVYVWSAATNARARGVRYLERKPFNYYSLGGQTLAYISVFCFWIIFSFLHDGLQNYFVNSVGSDVGTFSSSSFRQRVKRDVLIIYSSFTPILSCTTI